jgi:hypothetical protein
VASRHGTLPNQGVVLSKRVWRLEKLLGPRWMFGRDAQATAKQHPGLRTLQVTAPARVAFVDFCVDAARSSSLPRGLLADVMPMAADRVRLTPSRGWTRTRTLPGRCYDACLKAVVKHDAICG